MYKRELKTVLKVYPKLELKNQVSYKGRKVQLIFSQAFNRMVNRCLYLFRFKAGRFNYGNYFVFR